MISPYELLAIALILPIVFVGVWLDRRFEVAGPRELDFEEWCRAARPLLFAIRCERASSERLAAALSARFGAFVQHRTGRYPWPRYAFAVHVDCGGPPGWSSSEGIHSADGVVRGRVERAVIRRLRDPWPDLGATLEEVVRDLALDGEVWLHTELCEGDDARGEARRGRGFTALLAAGEIGERTLAPSPPAWAAR
ncbi:MAG: hypothetical protein U0271_10000 [Polyangiaceae bacterium]